MKAEYSALLVHPHIAELIDAGVTPAGQPYLVLEHIEGDHIDRYCDQQGWRSKRASGYSSMYWRP